MNELVKAAVEAQTQYCDEHEQPMFIPRDGYCEHCMRPIFGQGGYTYHHAMTRLLTSCPFCHKTFCD